MPSSSLPALSFLSDACPLAQLRVKCIVVERQPGGLDKPMRVRRAAEAVLDEAELLQIAGARPPDLLQQDERRRWRPENLQRSQDIFTILMRVAASNETHAGVCDQRPQARTDSRW